MLATTRQAQKPRITLPPHADGDEGGRILSRVAGWVAETLDAPNPLRVSPDAADWLGLDPSHWRARRILDMNRGRPAGAWSRLRVVERRGITVAKVLTPYLLAEDEVAATCRELADLLDDGHRRILLDLERVERLASHVLAVILAADRRCRSEGGALRLCGLRPAVVEALAITGLDRTLTVEPDAHTALMAFWPAPAGPGPLPIELLRALGNRGDEERPGDSDALGAVPSGMSKGLLRVPRGRQTRPTASWEDRVAEWLRDGDRARPADMKGRAVPLAAAGLVELRGGSGLVSGRIVLDALVVAVRAVRLEGAGPLDTLRDELADLLERTGCVRMVADLSGVIMLSSRALGVLVAHHLRLSRAGGALRLAHVRPSAFAILLTARLPELIATFPTVDEAVLVAWS